MRRLAVPTLSLCIALTASAHAQDASDRIALSRLVDCTAFAGTLEGFYSRYREATDDNQFVEAEKRADRLQLAWAQILYARVNVEIERQRDADAITGQMDWIYRSGETLPDHTGLGNAVVIFENRLSDCERDMLEQ